MKDSMKGLIRELWESGDRDSAIKAVQQQSATDQVESYNLLAELFLNTSMDAETIAAYQPVLLEGCAVGSISCQILLIVLTHKVEKKPFNFAPEEIDILLDAVEQTNHVALKLITDVMITAPKALEPYANRIFERLERSTANQCPELDNVTATIVQAAFSSEENPKYFHRFVQYLHPLFHRGNKIAFSILWAIRYFSENNPYLVQEVDQWAYDMEELVPGVTFFMNGFCCNKANDLKGAAENWQKGSLLENIQCTLLYAECLIRGLGVQQDFSAASFLLEPLIRENLDAARLAAYIAMFGQAEPDLERAFSLLIPYLRGRLQASEKKSICEDLVIYTLYVGFNGVDSPKGVSKKLVELLDQLDPKDNFLSGYKLFAAYHGLIDLGKSQDEIASSVIGSILQGKLDIPMQLILIDYTGNNTPGPNSIFLSDLAKVSVIQPAYRYEMAVMALRYAQDSNNQPIIDKMLSLIATLASEEQQVEAKMLYYAQKIVSGDKMDADEYDEYMKLTKMNLEHPVVLYLFLEAITKGHRSELAPEFQEEFVSTLRKVLNSGNWYALMSVAKLLEGLSESLYGRDLLDHWHNKLIQEAESGSFIKHPDEVLKQLAASNNCGRMALGC